jgi:fibronectin-binding autotransporter adhesin
LAAAPSLLLADGSVDQGVVARLNGESYASASQIGIENGLAIAAALRTASTSGQGEEAGFFTFGQALGGWRRLAGDATLGTSSANVSTYGALAGIGFGTQDASIGAYVGYIDARQQIAGLQARTNAGGMLAGVIAQGAAGGLQIAASLSYDGSKANTDRSLFGGSKVSSHYRLRSWTADLSLGHAFALDQDWTIAPEIGVTTSRPAAAAQARRTMRSGHWMSKRGGPRLPCKR